MKIHGLNLDQSPLIAQDKSLSYAENIAIGEGNQSYVNEDGFENKISILDDIQKNSSEINIVENDILHVIGTIPTNIGFVLFCVLNDVNNITKESFILYYKNNELIKIIHFENNNANLNINRPIHGDYIYNYKEDLIICFTEGIGENTNETRIINVNNPKFETESKVYNRILDKDLKEFKLIPDITYPALNLDVQIGGNLLTGAYQIAIKYKLNDGSYTNYSILTPSVIVSGEYGEDNAPNTEINRKIKVSFNKPEDINFKTYRLAIVHIIETGNNCYETEDIELNDTNEYLISNLNNYESIILDDIFIKNIAYIKEQTIINYNNKLIRGNVQTLNYQDLNLKDFTDKNFEVKIDRVREYTKVINKDVRYFKDDEIYVIFVGYFDNKGDLINIYPIPNINNDKLNNNVGFYIKPSNTNNIRDYCECDLGIYGKELTVINNQYSLNIHPIDRLHVYDWTLNWNTNYFDSNRYFSINTYSENIDTGITDPISGESVYIMNNIAQITNQLDVKCIYKFKNKFTIYLTQFETDTNNINLILKIGNTTKHIEYNEISENIEGLTYIGFEYDINETFELNPKDSIDISLHVIGSTDITNDASTLNGFIRISDLNGELNSELITIYKNFNKIPEISIRCTKDLPQGVNSIAYFFIEHNTYNSRVLSQALVLPNTDIINFTNNQEYDGQFQGTNSLRLYPFEYLYNKISKLKTKIKWNRIIGNVNGSTNTSSGEITFDKSPFEGTLDKSYAVIDGDLVSKKYEADGVKILDCDIEDSTLINITNPKNIINLEYVSNDNTSQQNIAGDSYFKTNDLNKDDLQFKNIYYIADLINPADELYSNLNNQTLQIASNMINKTEAKNFNALIGDTYLSYLTIRATTPSKSFRYGDSENIELDSNSTVFRWIFTFPIESKYNIKNRFSNNIVDKPYFLHGAKLEEYKELLSLSYKVDNYINTPTGKGYSTVYNENGIEKFDYYDTIPGTNNHPYRIIRSDIQNVESIDLKWRSFKSDNYKDMPFNRGPIISLKTDNKNLYIQQQYGLHLLQERDQLNSDDANQSYLGTSDLFNMEPKEIMYSPSGYIGCESYFDTHINTVGYVVIDSVHKKIFMLNGTKLNEISNLKTREYFKKFIENDLKNPYNKRGRIINYNEDKNILYITQLSGNNKTSKTMSFSPINNAWLSFHTYIPDFGFVNRNGLYWGKNGVLYQPQSSIKGKYFDNTPNDSIIQFILNENTIYNKLLKTIVWKDQVSHRDSDYIQYFFKETIDNLMVHNFDQCSGKLDVAFNNDPKKWWDGSTGVNKINIWRFNKLFDLVENPNNPIIKNHIIPETNNLKVDYKWYSINRFICQFIYLTLWYNNNEDNKSWELIDVNPEWQIDNRNDQNYGNQNNNKE